METDDRFRTEDSSDCKPFRSAEAFRSIPSHHEPDLGRVQLELLGTHETKWGWHSAEIGQTRISVSYLQIFCRKLQREPTLQQTCLSAKDMNRSSHSCAYQLGPLAQTPAGRRITVSTAQGQVM